MDCQEVMSKIDAYFEHRLTDIERKKIKNHLNTCRACKEAFEELEVVFNLLDEHSEIDFVVPSDNFTKQVMDQVYREDSVTKFRKKTTLKGWGASLVAAGILITLMNTGFIDYRLETFLGDFYKGSMSINQRITEPLMRSSELLDYKTIADKVLDN